MNLLCVFTKCVVLLSGSKYVKDDRKRMQE